MLTNPPASDAGLPTRAPWSPVARRAQTDDDVLASLLIDTWTLITGRVLRSDVPPSQLSEEELIAFWADDHVSPAGIARLPRDVRVIRGSPGGDRARWS